MRLRYVIAGFFLIAGCSIAASKEDLAIDPNVEGDYGVKVYISETTAMINIKIKVLRDLDGKTFSGYSFGVKNFGSSFGLEADIPLTMLEGRGCITEKSVEQFSFIVVPELADNVGVDLSFKDENGNYVRMNLDLNSYLNKYREQNSLERLFSHKHGVGGKFTKETEALFANEFDCM